MAEQDKEKPTAKESMTPEFLKTTGTDSGGDDTGRDEKVSAESGEGGSPEQLKAAEEAGNTQAATEADQAEGGGFYQPEKQKAGRRKFWTRKRAISVGIVVLVVGGSIGLFSVVSGPLQFLHASQLLAGAHFLKGSPDILDGRVSSRFALYALSGKTAKGRLGVWGDRRADKWESRLAANGLKMVYSPDTNRGIGVQITDPDNPRAKAFIQDMEARGFNTDGRFDGSAVDIDSNPVDPNLRSINTIDDGFGRRNTVIRRAIRTTDLNGISRALGSRLLIKRSGTNGLFHPFRSKALRSFDNYVLKKRRSQEHDSNKRRTGRPDTPDTNSSRLRRRISDNLRSRLRSGQIAIAAAVLYCGVREYSSAIDAQNLDNQLAMMRMGLEAVSYGEQIKGLEDLDWDVLSIANDHFYDPETSTSWLSDPGIQYESGEEPAGYDYLEEKKAKPGSKEKPALLNAIDKGFPGSGILCRGVNAVSGAVGAVAGPFLGPVQNLVDSAIKGLSGRTSEEWFQWSVEYFADGPVNVLAQGSEWGGLVNVGTRLGANEQCKLNGCRELSEQEAQNVKQTAAAEAQASFAQAGIYERYFNLLNVDSLASTLFLKAPKTLGQMTNGLAKLPSFFGSLPLNLVGGKAQAATEYDYGFPLYGFSMDELEDERFENPYAVGNYYADNPDKLDEMNKEYGNDCFGMTISQTGNLQYSTASGRTDLTDTPDKCRGKSTDLLRYRFYIAYIVASHAYDCYDGFDEGSCDQLYGKAEDTTPAGSVEYDHSGCPTTPVPIEDTTVVEGIRVHKCIAEQVGNMVQDARADGVNLSGGGWRDPQNQIRLRRQNCGTSHYAIYEMRSSSCRPPTAKPGTSLHERGLAIDFANCNSRGTACFRWLSNNAARHGFKNLPSEPWHWSTSGG